MASGPTIHSTIEKKSIFRIFKQYNLSIEPKIKTVLRKKTKLDPEFLKRENDSESPEIIDRPKGSVRIDPQRNIVYCIGNITQAIESVQEECRNLNIPILFLTSSLNCEAKEAGFFLGSIARENIKTTTSPLLILCGGETTVTHDGSGKGGRNQELALAFSQQISGCKGITLLSLATDGTDGPTDAAGAIVDGTTWKKISKTNDARASLKNHNSYEVLKRADSLVFTGATGTNVNDIQLLWINPN